MAHPFGSQPKLKDYLEWACSEGCDYKEGVNTVNGVTTVTTIKSPDRKHFVVVSGVQQSELLMPTYINYLDRRLNMTSPFPSWPSVENEPA